MKHESYGLSDRGKTRKENQDAILLEPELGAFAISDGCGGHFAGELASRMAVETVAEVLRRQADLLRTYAQRPTARRRIQAVGLIQSAINTASEAIHQAARAEPGKAGMGATVVLLALLGDRAVVAHAGDSRAYLYRHGQIHPLTEDHSLANRYVRMGVMSRREAQESPFARIVTRAVGFHANVQADLLHFELVPDDLLLLCSDGATMYLSDEELAKACRKLPARSIPKALVHEANRRGGEDNISAIAVHLEAGRPREGDDIVRRLHALQRVPLFKHLLYAELLRVLDISRVEAYEAGNRILAEGDPSDRFFVSISGPVHVVKNKQLLAKLPPGSLFGEMGLIDQSPRSADVIAPEGARLLVIHRDDFFALLRREMSLAVKVLWGLCRVLNERLRSTSKELAVARKLPEKPAPSAPPEKTSLDELAEALRPFV